MQVHLSGENDPLQQMASFGVSCLVGKHCVHMNKGLSILQRYVPYATCQFMRRINLYLPILVIFLVVIAKPGTLQRTDCRKASHFDSLAPGKLSYGSDQVCTLSQPYK